MRSTHLLALAAAAATTFALVASPGLAAEAAPTAVGTAQLVTAYEYLFKAIQLSVHVTIDEVIIKDDISFVRTHSNGTTHIHATGENIPAENREFFLLPL